MDKSVSVIIPTYNRCRLVMDAVESVTNQGMSDVEVVVVDDGSTDNTRALFDRSHKNVRYIYQENKGVSAARNRGVAESTGQFIAFLDSDDLWAPGKLRSQIGLVTSNSVLSFQGVEWFVDRKEDEPLLQQASHVKWPRLDSNGFLRDPLLDVAEGRYLHLGSMLCTREAFMQIGWFDTSLRLGEDEDWFSRASLQKRLHYTSKPFLRRRFHVSQTATDSEDALRNLVEVFERIVARTSRLHPKASRAASRRLAAKWSQLANCLHGQSRRDEAIEAMIRSYGITPLNLPRLAKLLLMLSRRLDVGRLCREVANREPQDRR
jgi:glycosyltransferase involved in cell wall biosynthesis